MAIDQCSHSFSKMAQEVLPDLMSKMYLSIKESIPVSQFVVQGVGVQRLLKQYEKAIDFQGCYVLIEGDIPLYVGISKQVFRRIKLHCRGKTHYDANLAYAIAVKQIEHKRSRNEHMKNNEFRKLFEEAKLRIQKCSFATIPIDNPLTLYLFEPYCAMELDTCEWNTFRTH